MFLDDEKVVRIQGGRDDMKKVVLFFMVLILVTPIVGCSSRVSEIALNDLITKLEQKGFNVISKDEKKEIFQGKRKSLSINKNENIDVYLYQTNEKMEEDSSSIDRGGTSYNNGKNNADIDWISLPHFFKKDNIIVLYVGENSAILEALEELLGKQFAGYVE